jgi:hypothetical protein
MKKTKNTMEEKEKHLHLFENDQDFEEIYNGTDYEEPWISYVEDQNRVDYNK